MIVPTVVFRLKEGQSGEQVLCAAEICCPVCILHDNIPSLAKGRIAFNEVVLGHRTSGRFEPLSESPLSHFFNSGIVTTASCPSCYIVAQMNDVLVQRLLVKAEEWVRQFFEARSAHAQRVS